MRAEVPPKWHRKSVISREDYDADRDDKEEGIELVHSFLEDDLVGKEGETCAYGEHFTF